MNARARTPRTAALLSGLVAALTLTACGAGEVQTPESPDDAGGTAGGGTASGGCPVGEPPSACPGRCGDRSGAQSMN